MSDWLLLALFGVHLAAFVELWRRRRNFKYVRLSLLFTALVAHRVLIIAGQADLALVGISVPRSLRALAYTLAAWSLIEIIYRRRRSRATERET